MASTEKGVNSTWYSIIFLRNVFFSKHQNKAEFANLDEFKILSSDFSGLRISTASLTSSAFSTSLASTASKIPFHQKTS